MIRIQAAALLPFVASLFAGSGSEAGEAEIVAQHLVEANLAGHDSHGVIRAPKYVGWVRDGGLLPNQHASVFLDSGALVGIDGGFGYGQVIGREAMSMVIDRAGQHGFCLCAIRNSRHTVADRRMAGAACVGRAGLHQFRQHNGLRHPGRALRRDGAALVGEPNCGRRARPRWSDHPRHLNRGDGGGEDPGRQE